MIEATTRARQNIVIGLLCLMIALMIGTQSGCASARTATIKAQVELLNKARDKFVKYNTAQQLYIVQQLPAETPKDLVRLMIAEFRRRITYPTVAALSAGYEQLAKAALDEDAPLTSAIKVVEVVVTFIDALKVGEEPPKTDPCQAPCSTL